jgi:FAD/FMN-containing dehydrogenase
VSPTRVDEISAAITRRNGLEVSVLGGGHDWAGRSVRAGGLTIDLRRMRGVAVDPIARVAVIGGGATAADVIAETSKYGLVAATGTVGSVGLTGLTLGGGYGLLAGRYGMAVDNVVAADVVLADGRHVRTDALSDPDLFWALRGGGGNFGVVASMEVRLHELKQVLAGFIMFPFDQAARVWAGVREVLDEAPDELTVQTGVWSAPDGSPVLMVLPCWSGDLEAGKAWTDRLDSLGTPLVSQVAPMPYGTLLRLYDEQIVDGSHYAIRTRTVRAYSPEVVDALIEAGRTRTSTWSGIPIHHAHGATTRVPVRETAFPHRDRHHVVEIVAAWRPEDAAAADRHVAWADAVSRSLEPVAEPGGYVNLLGPESQDQVDLAYGPNTARLLAVKRRYDPENVFAATGLPRS